MIYSAEKSINKDSSKEIHYIISYLMVDVTVRRKYSGMAPSDVVILNGMIRMDSFAVIPIFTLQSIPRLQNSHISHLSRASKTRLQQKTCAKI